jgi:hypothetical protein
MSHSIALLSPDVLNTFPPCGRNETLLMYPVWPASTADCAGDADFDAGFI